MRPDWYPPRWLAAIALVLATSLSHATAPGDGSLVLGVLCTSQKEITAERFEPLADYLSAALGSQRVSLSVFEADEMEDALRHNRLDFVLTNPQHYLTLRSHNSLSGVIATLVQVGPDGRATQAVGGVIVADASRPHGPDTLADLRGQRIATPGPRHLGGYVAPAYELLQAGIRLPVDVELLERAHESEVLDAVVSGAADAGFVRTSVIEERIARGLLPADRIKIINRQDLAGYPFAVSTRLYPGAPFIALPHVDTRTVSRMAAALLAIGPTDPVARAARISGFAPPADYLSVELAARDLRVPPFQRAPQFTWRDMLERYSLAAMLGLVVVAVIVGLMVVVAVRNRQLARSGEALADANAGLRAWSDVQRSVGDIMAELLGASSAARGGALQKVLEHLGARAAVDRVTLMLCTDNGQRIAELKQWTAPGVDALAADVVDTPVCNATWWWEQFVAGRVVAYADPADLSKRAAAENVWFGGDDVRSVLAAGLQKGGTPFGVISLQTAHQTRIWSEKDTTLLRLTAEALSSALDRWKIERRLKLMQVALDHVSEAVYLVDADARFRYVNEGAVRALGYSRSEFAGMNVADIDPNFPPQAWPGHWRQLERDQSMVLETVHRRRDGSEIPVELLANHMIYEGEAYSLGLARDIGERRRIQEQLQLAASVFSHAREGIIIAGPDHRIVDVNEAFTRITGYARDEVIGENPRFLKSGRHRAEFYQAIWAALDDPGYWSGEIWNRRKGGALYPQAMTISRVLNDRGEVQNYVAVFSDITDLKQQQQQLEHIARYDALTNLPNRVSLADRLAQAMALVRRHGQRLAVVYIDLDGFKAVNDEHGHDVGDELLVAVATRMKFALRESDTVARIGGDEFVAVLMDLDDIDASVPELERLLHAVAQPVRVGAFDFQVSASIGATFFPQEEDVDADQLLRQADQAMYQAKLAGRNRFQLFDTEADRSVRGRTVIQQYVREALASDGLRLHYQPKVNMRTGAVVGAEALIRLQHPERGLLQPGEFLPAVDDHPLAVELGNWVIAAALDQLKAWSDAGIDVPISVNIGAHHLQHPGFVGSLKQAMGAQPEVAPGRLVLEVLETSALQDLGLVSRVMRACGEFGIRFALDDFGTGYSSLTYLKHLPADQLKIDQSFVRDALDDPEDLSILEGVMGLAAAFQREVIAEGVETAAHGALLLQLGCELAQGHAIAHAMPPEDLPDWIEHWQPDPSWRNQRRIARVDLPVIFAAVEHRAWVRSLRQAMQDVSDVVPPRSPGCRFDQWLDGEGERAHGNDPSFAEIRRRHQQLHDLAGELLDQWVHGRRSVVRSRLPELDLVLQAMLDQFEILLAMRSGR